MITIWVIFAVMAGLSVFAVLWPLSRAPLRTDTRELDVAFYEAQTAEIARDKDRGILGDGEAESARTEAARRLMAARQRPGADVTGSSVWGVRLVALATLVLVPALALGLYTQIGAPSLPDDPLQARLAAPPATMDLATAIGKIEQHLAKNPNDGRGWAVIAPIYVRLGRPDDAIRAYTNVIRLLGPSGDRYAGLGESEVFAAGGTVTADAKKSFEQAVALDPNSPRGLYYIGLASEQDGNKGAALQSWRRLVAVSPPDAPWLPTVQNHIAAATGEAPSDATAAAPPAGVPSQAAAAVAAMPQEQQMATIHRMVDGLADRLKANGNDIDGWLRLVRAYRVLNEQDKAKVALSDAKRNFAADPTATKRLDDLAHELGLEG